MGVNNLMFPFTDIRVNRQKKTIEGEIDGDCILYVHAILTDAINIMCDEDVQFKSEVIGYDLPEVKAKRKIRIES